MQIGVPSAERWRAGRRSRLLSITRASMRRCSPCTISQRACGTCRVRPPTPANADPSGRGDDQAALDSALFRTARSPRGQRIKDMVKSNWVYQELRNFRAVEHLVSGAGSTTSKHTSGPQSSLATSPYLLALSRPDSRLRPSVWHPRLIPGRSLILIFSNTRFNQALTTARAIEIASQLLLQHQCSQTPANKHICLWTDTGLNGRSRDGRVCPSCAGTNVALTTPRQGAAVGRRHRRKADEGARCPARRR